MKSGLCFLIAAKRCDIAELQQLALTSALVNACGRLVHALQRERGLSNLYLGSQGQRWAEERRAQVQQSRVIQDEVLACFDSLDTDASGHGARLFSRIAYVLQGLDALPGLRAQVETLAWTPARATAAYIRLVSGLLAVVFEAADSASDPDISRRLVALFNFMQGKEFAGQERATGSALFAAGRADVAGQQQLLHLIESQERCLQVFADFASEALVAAWRDTQRHELLAGLERMRRILCTAAAGAALDAGLSQPWFDGCTARIDAMKTVEDRLAAELLALCEQRIEAARADLTDFERLQDSVPSPGEASLSFFDDRAGERPLVAPGLASAGQGYGLQLERSILDLVQEQAQRLQTVSTELDTVRASLNERKLVERAKGLLMAHRHLSEEEAHKTMRQMAMNQNRRLIEVAEAVLAMADMLPEPRR
jgi:Nitrate and nitrite sensing/ANTAR domain